MSTITSSPASPSPSPPLQASSPSVQTVPLPRFYRELQRGEEIMVTDRIKPKNKSSFRGLRRDSKCIGKPYKEKCFLLPETVVVRKMEIPNLNIFCKAPSPTPVFFNDVVQKIREHPIFSQFNLNGLAYHNPLYFYIISSEEESNYYVGATNAPNSYRILKVEFDEFMSIIYPQHKETKEYKKKYFKDISFAVRMTATLGQKWA